MAEKDAAFDRFAKAIGLGPAQIVVDGKLVDPPLNDVEAHRQRVDAAIAKDKTKSEDKRSPTACETLRQQLDARAFAVKPKESRRWASKARGSAGSPKPAGIIAALNLDVQPRGRSTTRSAARGSPAERPGALEDLSDWIMVEHDEDIDAQ